MIGRRLAALTIAAAVALGGCSRGKGEAGPTDAGQAVLRMNLGTEPETLDWTRARDSVSYDVVGQLMDGLTRHGTGGEILPALAARWTVSDDGLTITFHLRDGVTWTDGGPLRAADFVYAWRRLLDPRTGAEYAYMLYPIAGARAFNRGETRDPASVGVRAVDDRTLEVRLERPAAYFTGITTFMVTYPLPERAVEKFGVRWTDPGNIVTLGPFRLTEWAHDDRIVLAANDAYWEGRPALDRVEMIMVGEASTAVALYETGEIDFIDNRSLPPSLIQRYIGSRGHASAPQLRANYIGFNTRKAPFDDVRVRAAFAHAIDRSLIPRVLRGGQVPTHAWIPPGMAAHNPGVGLPHDPDKARRLLAEAGYPGGKGFPETTVAYNTRDDHKTLVEALQAMWKETLGVSVRVENQEWKVFLRTLVAEPPPMYRLGWGADYPDPHNFMELFTSESGNNHTGWGDAEFDRLVDEASRITDPARRRTLYDAAQRRLLEVGTAIAPTHVATMHYVVRPRVHGLAPNTMGILDLRPVRIAHEDAAAG